MPTDVIVTDEFRDWYEDLTDSEQKSVRHYVNLLAEAGVMLGFPYCSGVEGSRFPEMRELRVQHAGSPYRVLYAFDCARQAVLLMGGNKTGKGRWMEQAIRLADRLWSEYLRDL